MKFAWLSEAHCYALNQREKFIDISDDILLHNVTQHCWAKMTDSAESTHQSAHIAESTKSNKHSDKYYPQSEEWKYLKVNNKDDYVIADKSALTASALTVNIITSVEHLIVMFKSHTHMITIFTMLTADTDNADTDELLILK